MARRMSDRREEPDAARHFGVILDKLPVLPRRKNVSDTLAGRSAAFRQLLDAAGLRPPLVFRAIDDQFGVGEDGGIGAFLHQPPDMIGMEMRDQNRADLAAVDTASLHVGRQVGGVGLPLANTRS